MFAAPHGQQDDRRALDATKAPRTRLLSLLLVALAVLAAVEGTGRLPAAAPAGTEPQKAEAPKSPAAPPTPPPRKGAGDKSTGGLTLEDLNLPPGTVIVICSDLKKGLEVVPNGVVLTPEEDRRLHDEIAQLRERLAAVRKPLTPSECRLSGKVTEDLVHLKVQFDFPTTEPGTLIALGCTQAVLTAATLDGQLPLLAKTDDGYVVQVDKPAERHQVVLELDLRLGDRPGGRGLDLDLPRAPLTLLDLELPSPAIKEVRLAALPRASGNARVTALPARVVDGKNRVLGAIDPLGHLDLSWSAQAQAGTSPLLMADGRITVRVGDTTVITDVLFTLKVLGGQVPQWRLLLPPHAQLVSPREPDTPVLAVENPDPKNPALHVLRLKAPRAEPLVVSFQVTQPRSAPLLVGPIAVLDTFSQQGVLVVTAPPDLRLTALPRGEPQVSLTPRDVPEERRKERPGQTAAFDYQIRLALDGKQAPALPAFLELRTEPAHGTSATWTAHTLKLAEDGWHLTTEVEVNPQQAGGGASHLDIQLPPGEEAWHLLHARERGQSLEIDSVSHLGRIVLASAPPEPFHVTLEGIYPRQADPEWRGQIPPRGATTLDLPHPVKVVDQGGQITAVVPPDMELLQPQAEDPTWKDLAPGESEYRFRSGHLPERITVSWRGTRPEMPTRNTVDVTLTAGSVQVRQALVPPVRSTPAVGAGSPRPYLLWVPNDPDSERLRLGPIHLERAGGTALPSRLDGSGEPSYAAEPEPEYGRGDPAPTATWGPVPKREGFRAWPIRVTAPLDADHPLILEYQFALPAADPKTRLRSFRLPLILPRDPVRVETTIHFWGEPGLVPLLAPNDVNENAWAVYHDLGGRSTLPALCLRGDHPDRAPVLLVPEPLPSDLTTVLVQRALVQVTLDEDGSQTHRVRFLINQLLAPHLDVELPAPLASLNLKAVFWGEGGPSARPGQPGLPPQQGKSVQATAVDDSGQFTETGRFARLPIDPDLVRKAVVLDLSYQVPAGRSPADGLWQTTCTPAELRGGTVPGRVAFQVHCPPAWVPLYRQGDFSLGEQWGWRGWLPAPRPTLGDADLERWFYRGFESRLGLQAQGAPGPPPDPASLVCWRSNLEPLPLEHPPQQVWLLLCSATLLLVGVGLYLLFFSPALLRPGEGRGDPARTDERAPSPPSTRAPGGSRRWRRLFFWPVVVSLVLVPCGLAVVWPGIILPVLYGCEPGALALVAVLAVQWFLHQRYRRQVVFLPGFKRMKTGSSLIRGKEGRGDPPVLRPTGQARERPELASLRRWTCPTRTEGRRRDEEENGPRAKGQRRKGRQRTRREGSRQSRARSAAE